MKELTRRIITAKSIVLHHSVSASLVPPGMVWHLDHVRVLGLPLPSSLFHVHVSCICNAKDRADGSRRSRDIRNFPPTLSQTRNYLYQEEARGDVHNEKKSCREKNEGFGDEDCRTYHLDMKIGVAVWGLVVKYSGKVTVKN